MSSLTSLNPAMAPLIDAQLQQHTCDQSLGQYAQPAQGSGGVTHMPEFSVSPSSMPIASSAARHSRRAVAFLVSVEIVSCDHEDEKRASHHRHCQLCMYSKLIVMLAGDA